MFMWNLWSFASFETRQADDDKFFWLTADLDKCLMDGFHIVMFWFFLMNYIWGWCGCTLISSLACYCLEYLIPAICGWQPKCSEKGAFTWAKGQTGDSLHCLGGKHRWKSPRDEQIRTLDSMNCCYTSCLYFYARVLVLSVFSIKGSTVAF